MPQRLMKGTFWYFWVCRLMWGMMFWLVGVGQLSLCSQMLLLAPWHCSFCFFNSKLMCDQVSTEPAQSRSCGGTGRIQKIVLIVLEMADINFLHWFQAPNTPSCWLLCGYKGVTAAGSAPVVVHWDPQQMVIASKPSLLNFITCPAVVPGPKQTFLLRAAHLQ